MVSGSSKIVNKDELEDLVEDIGAKLVRQSVAKVNELASDGTTISIVLAQGLIAEGVNEVAVSANSILITRGIERTTKVEYELKAMSKEVKDSKLSDVSAVVVSAENNYELENMILEAMSKVGRMKFDGGYISPYVGTDREKMTAEFGSWKLLCVDKRLTNVRYLIGIPEEAIRSGYSILRTDEDIERKALATLVVNKLRGSLEIVSPKLLVFLFQQYVCKVSEMRFE